MTGLARAPRAAATTDPRSPAGLLGRVRVALSTVLAGVLGVLPHVLHHAGPLAGAALFAGVGGSLLFGAVGLLAAVPLLLRMHRRCGNWRRPLAALGLFAAVFSLSTFVIGPALTSSDGGEASEPEAPAAQPAPERRAPSGHEGHH